MPDGRPARLDLLVIRHGQSEWNALGRGHGWGDPPLSQLGRRQAADAASGVASQGLRRGSTVFASDLRRARQTAEILAERVGLGELRMWCEFREHNIGDWDGHTWAEIEQRWPNARAEWAAERIDRPPNGESRAEFHARVLRGLDQLGRANSSGRHLLVAHGGVVRALEGIANAEVRPIDFLSGRWFAYKDGHLTAGAPFSAVKPPGEDF